MVLLGQDDNIYSAEDQKTWLFLKQARSSFHIIRMKRMFNRSLDFQATTQIFLQLFGK